MSADTPLSSDSLNEEERAVRKVSANEVWLVRIRDNATLTKVRVLNKYIKTVELKMVDGIGSSFYTWNDVEFVERICNAPERTSYERGF